MIAVDAENGSYLLQAAGFLYGKWYSYEFIRNIE